MTSQENGLRAALEAAMAEDGLSMKDLTVLAPQNDPFRVDTPAGHRDGEWLAVHAEKLGDRRIHLRGLHYMVISEIKPNGKPYTNTEEDWLWLQAKAGKAARWLGYIPFEKITDERNSPPVERVFQEPDPTPYIDVGVNLEIPDLDEVEPTVGLNGFTEAQPFKLVLFGEKTSLEEVLAPIAESRRADLYLPTGEASDTMIHQMASTGAEDGRHMVVFYLSDCDPAGHQMAVSVARKLQAFKVLEFPELSFEVRPVALTPDQVREYRLPSTPLKATEKRGDAWTTAMGVEQTEIDALATLKPDLLDKIVRKAMKPFYDPSLAERVREVRREWEARAQARLVETIGEEQLERLRADAAEKLETLHDEVDAINAALRIEEVEGLELPAPPPPPTAEIDAEVDGKPLIDSSWDHATQSQRLIDYKAYKLADGNGRAATPG